MALHEWIRPADATALEMEASDYPFVLHLERNSQLLVNLRQIDPVIRQLRCISI
jgi:hypothetical protein